MELTRRTVLVSFVVIGLAAAAAGAGTMALFSDQETSTDNTVQAGTLNLDIGDDTENLGDVDDDGTDEYGADGTFSFDIGPLAPGEQSQNTTLTVANEGNIDAGTLQWTYDVSNYDGAHPDSEEGSVKNIDEHIQVQIWYGTTGGGAETEEVTQAIDAEYGDGDGTLYLDELEGETIVSTVGMNASVVRGINHKFKLDSSTDDRYQGDFSEIDLTVDLLQEDIEQ